MDVAINALGERMFWKLILIQFCLFKSMIKVKGQRKML